MAALLRNPHFAMPMRMDRGHVAVVEQGSYYETYNSVLTLLRYEIGQRAAEPNYGIPDQALRENGADITRIVAAIMEWVPEAEVTLSRDDVIKIIDRVSIEVGIRMES